MKRAAAFLLFAAVASAGKRYVVCLAAGEDHDCTRPLSKEASQAVYEVFMNAPIGGLDAVYIIDAKTKKIVRRALAPAQPEQPPPATGEKL